MSSLNQKPVTFQEEETVFAMADKAIGDSLEDGNFELAAEAISRYRSLSRVSELGQSKILHGVNHHWHDVDHPDGDTFFDWSVRATGYVSLTIERHISVWEMLSGAYIPQEYRDQVKSQTIRQLFKIFSLVVVPRKTRTCYEFMTQDYWMEKEDWRDLSEAHDEQRVSEIVSRIKGKERNKNFMSLKIDSKGDVFVYQNNNSEYAFSLPIHSTNPLLIKTCRRVMDGAGITQRDEY